MDDYTYETIVSEDGNLRAVVKLDTESYDMKPDGDCYGTVLYQEAGWSRHHVSVWCERYNGNEAWESIYSDLWDALRDLDNIEMVLRGTANVCAVCEAFIDVDGRDSENRFECDDDEDGFDHEPRFDFSDNPVVGFAVVELREGRLINIVTLADLKVWGFETVEDFDAAMVKHYGHSIDPSRHNLDDFEAWANGDVYYVEVERLERGIVVRAVGENLTLDPETGEFGGNIVSREQHEFEDWESTGEGCHGFYSTESAEEYAESIIAGYDATRQGSESA